MYRLIFTRTWGDDHVCYTELEFIDYNGNPINATYLSQTTCYGCAIACDSCTADYGNPLNQFDKEWENAVGSAWTCTDVGSFNPLDGGYGNQIVVFDLDRRPTYYSIKRASVAGDTASRDWRLEEQQGDGSWRIISSVVDSPKNMSQTNQIAPDSGLAGQWYKWVPMKCNFDVGQTWLGDDVYKGDVATPVQLNTAYWPMENLQLGNNGYGIYIDGDFGHVEIDGFNYEAKQVHWIHPSERVFGTDPVIEYPMDMRIVHQKTGSEGADDLAIIVVPLRLPLEADDLNTDAEMHWMQIGLDVLPVEGAMKALQGALNLTVLNEQLAGVAQQLPCQGDTSQKWFVTPPAHVTGGVVDAFATLWPKGVILTPAPTAPPMSFDMFKAENRYNQLGRQEGATEVQLPVPEVIQVKVNETPQEIQWVPNPRYIPACGDFLTVGEWGLPPKPTTAAPPTEFPATTTADPLADVDGAPAELRAQAAQAGFELRRASPVAPPQPAPAIQAAPAQPPQQAGVALVGAAPAEGQASPVAMGVPAAEGLAGEAHILAMRR